MFPDIYFCNLLEKDLKIKIHKTLKLPVVLYGGEEWSLTLRERGRLRDPEAYIWGSKKGCEKGVQKAPQYGTS